MLQISETLMTDFFPLRCVPALDFGAQRIARRVFTIGPAGGRHESAASDARQEDTLPHAAFPAARRRALLTGLLGLAAAPARAAVPPRLLETGSTLLYPLFTLWVSAYSAKAPGV